MGGNSRGPTLTIFDFYIKKGYQCDFCGHFDETLPKARQHMRQFHGSKVREAMAAEREGEKYA